jgi:protein O-mannosyl-transferase
VAKRRIYQLFPVAVALLTLGAFLPALENGWVDWDDRENFLDNPDWLGLGPSQLKWMWTTHLMGHYIPVTWMTLGFDYKLWGMDAAGYHLSNILWHAANAVLFYFIAVSLLTFAIPAGSVEMRARIPFGALFAALLFGLHPLRAESVAWITERRDVVSGMFYLLAILIYLRAFQDTSRHPILPWRNYWSCIACFILAILSKEIAVTLPLILLLLDIWPLRRFSGPLQRWFSGQNRRVLLEKIPFLAISVAAGALSLYSASRENLNLPLSLISWPQRLAITVYGLAFYIRKTCAPFHLAPFYPLTRQRVDLAGLPFLASAALIISIAAIAFLTRRRWAALTIALLSYGITLVPVSGIFQNGRQIAADRYSYLACLGWALVAGGALLWAFNVLPRLGRQVLTILAATALGALAWLTWRQVQIWSDPETLWREAMAVEPSFMAANHLGVIFEQRRDYLHAAEEYRLALQMNPNDWDAHFNLAWVQMDLRDWEAAAEEFGFVLRLRPTFADAHRGLGYAEMKQGRLDEAIAQFRIALSLDPRSTDARNNLNEALAQKAAGR